MSKEIKHTPGPWVTARYGGHETEVRCKNSKGRRIAATWVQCAPKSREGYKVQAEINAANARLIAAAPDLLESLCTVLALAKIKYGNLHDDVNEVFAKADAAIAKARGE